VIALLRVDNRLLHGQILEAWLPRLGVKEIVVADDDAAASPLAKAAMTLCLPVDLPVRILSVAETPWGELAESPRAILVLVRDVAAIERARAAGLAPALARRVNVGNVHFGPARRPITPSVFLDGGEVNALRAMAQEGFDVEARAVPTETPAGIDEIERRYAHPR
jgi:PTS system N-acetylgalactosamine-specific IIB component